MNVEQVQQLTDSIQKALAALNQHCQSVGHQGDGEAQNNCDTNTPHGFPPNNQPWYSNPYGNGVSNYGMPWNQPSMPSGFQGFGWSQGYPQNSGTFVNNSPNGWNRFHGFVPSGPNWNGYNMYSQYGHGQSNPSFPSFPTGGSYVPYPGHPIANQNWWNQSCWNGPQFGYGFPQDHSVMQTPRFGYGWPAFGNVHGGNMAYPFAYRVDPMYDWCGQDMKLAA